MRPSVNGQGFLGRRRWRKSSCWCGHDCYRLLSLMNERASPRLHRTPPPPPPMMMMSLSDPFVVDHH
jgi:hypothetical protein